MGEKEIEEIEKEADDKSRPDKKRNS